ncbi:MAG: NAD-dependent malic enzyme [Nitrospirae bacterium CG_4_10_14_3_um_filter_44_29]|nr:NAD-dependent malic enzyme [Nitrospirota bacterium]PIV42188.1 MAG: NAD-dependent malic enzyme [Nitrospirae bacterium CG02_land_8_20_14_3_00_44_33]PIW89629.1 MAG: NAD-dependent malic enzyme [Nitrospirae bacterium CG_4_8_14_3_um_filter_44_28]PIX87858.1 MAG: NAD-dependent malic enzyme [Nitrospirae bacterium CG_4_10_14_3_um_filter_44_29]
MAHVPSPSYSITIRFEIDNRVGMFAKLATAISYAEGDLGSIDIVRVEKGKIIRDITVNARDEEHEKNIVTSIKNIAGIRILRVMDRTFSAHEGGKIEIHNKVTIRDSNDLSKIYTPGVARVCMDIHENKEHLFRYTIKGNSIAVVTDGTAVLGLGNIGPEAAMPVMEGKAMIFKEFAGIDAFPIALKTTVPDEIVNTVKNISIPFGGINLEDISAPRCFEIEERLRRELDIPVIHDDQHGTAVVVLAALINVSRLLKKNIKKFRVVISGAGAAGMANANMLSLYGVKDIIVCDRKGAIYDGRRGDMNPYKKALAKKTNPRDVKGSISDALKDANVFIGLSVPNVITKDDIRKMSKEPVVFALANPEPEIAPEDAFPIARILATGRSDYPNQINNMLSFPGIFRGLLDVRAKGVNEEIKFAAAEAIAHTIKDDELHEDYIIPSGFDRKVVSSVAHAVAETARKTGLARH